MKINQILIIFTIILCIIAAGYLLRPGTDKTVENITFPATTPSIHTTTSNTSYTIIPIETNFSSGSGSGELTVTIGQYNAILTVLTDDKRSGNVSKGNPLNLKLSEGSHTIKVCAGTVCESIDVNIKSAIKTTIDFEERLNRVLPQGSLNVSIGDYPTKLQVLIDNSSSGTVSPDKPLNLVISSGHHSVKVCRNNDCFSETVNIAPGNLTTVDFGTRLKGDIPQTEIVVSIGGFDAQLPVKIDNVTVGTVAQGKPFKTRVNTGEHVLMVCFGAVCEKEQITATFGKPVYVDFGEQLQRDVEFSKPTARIVSTNQNGNTLVVEVEFINPNAKDVTISATISCQYTYLNSNRERVGDSARVQVTRVVKSNDRPKQNANIYLSGSGVIASPPVITEMTIL